MERVPTFIPGFDELIEGGFPKGSIILISGNCGAGKTIFAGQYLWNGAIKANERGLFISTEERKEDLVGDFKLFGWDFESNEKLNIEYVSASEIDKEIEKLKLKVKENDVKRLVIDSISLVGFYYGMNYQNIYEIRKRLYYLINVLKDLGVTSILTSELPEGQKNYSRFGVEEFVVDGVVILKRSDMVMEDGFDRMLEIKKLRRTDHYKEACPFKITKEGIIVKKTSL